MMLNYVCTESTLWSGVTTERVQKKLVSQYLTSYGMPFYVIFGTSFHGLQTRLSPLVAPEAVLGGR